ncbi:uncharacterized protein LOC111708767 isoform X2 [Eurytemora carolleeae]|uniref:uncharacterized protein LOC111708767 isoform X2 n=1 Tax=Eurytemora carolleeae TaxID=1294199 RepID=UPI000C78851B|nr:uncharacterized protein LOC111708767 isoform X2 [Eurytemora carolleeae]|eukprot:XP_023338016.1 uncharacterized protein LOC111708767 isoform X2 [Eurytemora affinis]
MTDIVQSEWVVDPKNSNVMIRRVSLSKEREYWDRVNHEGESVFSVARMFENQEKVNPSQPVHKPGKLNRQSFVEIFSNAGEIAKPEIKTGRIDVQESVWELGLEQERETKPNIRVGKLNTQNLFQNQEEREEMIKPKANIGKLDPHQIFNSKQENKENVKEVPRIGRINPETVFQHSFSEPLRSPENAPKIGKIDLGSVFENGTEENKVQERKVGKLRVQESSLFENPEPKPRVEVGKLNPESIFKPSPPSEEKFEIKIGKIDTSNLFRAVDPVEPIVQPLISVGKLNPARNPFREPSPEDKPRVKVGKIKPKQFLPDSPIDDKPELVVGKLNPENIFPLSPSHSEEVKFYKPTVQPKKMKVEQVFPLLMQEEPRIQDEKEGFSRETKREIRKLDLSKVFETVQDSGIQEHREESSPIQVGKLRSSIFEQVQVQENNEPIPVRGARRVNKGNRISCLIENLGTERAEEVEERRDEDDKEVEDLKLGRNRMSQIQSMFSGSQSDSVSPLRTRNLGSDRGDSETPYSEFSELRDEGLVSTNLHRFTTGNILGGGSNTTGRKPSLVETNYIDKKHIESVTAKFDGGISTDSSVERREKLPVGKLRNPESFLQQQQDTEEETHQKVRVGKLNSDIFKVQSESEEPSKPILRVGKLNTENLFPKPEETQPKPQPKVGKISTKDLFERDGGGMEEEVDVSCIRVGKLTESRFRLSSDISEIEKDTDTNIVPSGMVAKSASAFIQTGFDEKSPSKLSRNNTITRKSKSGDCELQKKYMEQTAGKLQEFKDKTASEASEDLNKIQEGSVRGVSSRLLYEDQAKPAEKIEVSAREKRDEELQNIKVGDAREKFFSSMISSSETKSSSAHRLGTSLLPTVPGAGIGVGFNKGKALFQRCQEKVEEKKKEELIPGVDFQEIEDEFERLHREMMGEPEE